MKKSFIVIASLAALAIPLTACSGSGHTATRIAQAWLDGDASVQCLGQPAPWSSFELGKAQLYEQTEHSELWTVEISGVRDYAPVSDGHVIVELREGGGSCVKRTQP